MSGVNSPTDHSPRDLLGLNPVIVGTACCIVSALCYTAANTCLTKLAVLKADAMWVTCMKEVVTVAVVGPWLVAQLFRGRAGLPSPRALLVLVLAGLAVQLGGNLSVQWAFGTVGIAVTIPAVFGAMLTAGAVFGLVFLGERVPGRSVAAIGLLILSVVLLKQGAGLGTLTTPGQVLLGVAAGCLGGAMFAVLSTVIRFMGTARVPVTTIVFIVTGMGVLSMGSLSLCRLGPQTLVETPREQLAWMLAAGTFNLVAFLAITKGLQLTTVVHANVLNASQVAMAGVVGVLLFREPTNLWLVLGICLTIAGVILIRGPSHDRPT